MSTVLRIQLWVSLCFAAVALLCSLVLVHQGAQSLAEELATEQAAAHYLRQTAEQDPNVLDSALAAGLRHLQIVRLPMNAPSPLTRSAPGWPFPPAEPAGDPLPLAGGEQAWLLLDPRDGIDEVRSGVLQLLVLFALALALSLAAIRWALARGLQALEELQQAFDAVAEGRLDVRLAGHPLDEAQRLVGHFNGMVGTLERVRDENAALTQALLDLQEHERKHLAMALHDDIGQYLVGIRAQLLLLRSLSGQAPGTVTVLQDLEGNCQRMQAAFRALVRDLYPTALERLALDDALRLLAEQWQQAQGIPLRLHLGASLPTLAPGERAHLYRLLQEALTNVARHAG
ncbi:histidine kinase, partial [Pseudomonas otitidis]